MKLPAAGGPGINERSMFTPRGGVLPHLSLFKWIKIWNTQKRRHSVLGYKTIEEFEILNNNQKLAA
jgi:hypothetical protein